MAGKIDPHDLSADQLRQLLIEKTRVQRRSRLEQFKKTGRVLSVDQPLGPRPLNLDAPDSPPETITKRRRGLNALLLLIEVAAVAGLLFVIFSGLKLLRDLNSQVAASLEQPTPSPTALISAVVLPSGHTPPTEGQNARFNDAEIPENLKPLVQSMAVLPQATSSPTNPIRIQISAIQVDAPVVLGDGWEQLKKGVGQHIGSANPGETGNMVLSAHNDVYGEIFRRLDQLKEGDEILVSTSQQTFTYVVKDTVVVEPTRVDVLASTPTSTITLISCYPYLVDNKRIVVTGDLLTNN